MGSNEKPSKKKDGIYDFFAQIAGTLGLGNMPNYQKFNVISSAIIAVVALALALPPVLAWVTNIIISIGNIIIIVTGHAEHIQAVSASAFVTVIIPLLLVVVESIICKIYCGFAAKINKTPDGGESSPPPPAESEG